MNETVVINAYIVISIIIAATDILLAVKSFKKNKTTGRFLGFACMGAAIVDISYLISIISDSYMCMAAMSSIYFISIDFMLVSLLIFTVYFTKGKFSGYGYDIKNDPAELVIASDVFMNALSPNSQGTNEVTGIIGKIMIMTEITAVKQLSKKTWEEMAKHGGVALLICQMRALANKAAQKALEKAGQKGLEESLFKGVFEQIGKSLSKKALGKAVPVAGAVIGAMFDTAQMNTVLEYADVFYNKRYLLEKEVRINTLLGVSSPIESVVIDVLEKDIVSVEDGESELQVE